MKLSKKSERRQSLPPRNERKQSIVPWNDILLKKQEKNKDFQNNKAKAKKMINQEKEKEIVQHNNEFVQEKEKQVYFVLHILNYLKNYKKDHD